MMSKILKLGLISIICMIFLISIVSAANTTSDDQSVLTLSKGGLSITYPSDWGYSKAKSNYSIMAISKLNSIDSAGVGQININFEKKPLEGDLETFVNSTYTALQSDSSFELVSSGGVVVGDKNALEFVYINKDNNVEKEHKAVWFEKGGQAYVILYSAPIDDFESNLYVFDYILSNIQIT